MANTNRNTPLGRRSEKAGEVVFLAAVRARSQSTPLVALLALAACSAGSKEVAFPRVLRVARAEYDAAPEFLARTYRVVCDGSTSEHCRLNGGAELALAANSHVLVAPWHERLAEFDSSGQVVRVLGSVDSARTDYRSVAAVTVDSARNVWVFDLRGLSWIGFTPSGAILERRAIPRLVLLRTFAARAGALYLQLIPPGARIGAPVTSTFLRLTPGDSLRPFAEVPALATQTDSSDMMPLPRPFAPRPVWDVRPGGELVYSNGAQYTIYRFSADGRPDLAIQGDSLNSRQVNSVELEAERKARASRGLPLDRSPLASTGASGRHPAITDLRALRDSTLLVRRVPPSTQADSVRWDIWDHGDRLAGHVKLGTQDHVVDGSRSCLLVASWSRDDAGRVAWVRVGRP